MTREDQYLEHDWFEDRDAIIKMATRKMVNIRKPRKCTGNGATEDHEMPKGSRMLVERALVDGEWGSWGLCIECMEQQLKELFDDEDSDE